MKAQASGGYPAAGKQQIIATMLWTHRLVAAIQQQQASSRDHSNSAMEAQASGSYPAVVQAAVQKLY